MADEENRAGSARRGGAREAPPSGGGREGPPLIDPTWKPLDPSGLKERLAQVRALLVQAAAVGMAQDVSKLEQYAELDRRVKEAARGPKVPRRYR